MTIEKKTTYTATSLPGAPPRETRAEAEADEARGVELAAYLATLPTLTEEQWDAARRVTSDADWIMGSDAAWEAGAFAARDAARDAAWFAAPGEAWDAPWGATWAVAGASWAARAIVVRDLITPAQFDTLTAPMRAAGVNFDGLTNHTAETDEQLCPECRGMLTSWFCEPCGNTGSGEPS